MTKPPPITQVQCARSPTGAHELNPDVVVAARDDRRFPTGTELFLHCRWCRAGGRAVLEDAQVSWDDAEKVPS